MKYLPITAKNQLKDNKVIKVVRKWASLFCPIVEAGSSSGKESLGNSPADSECTAGTEHNDDENQQLSKSIDGDKKAISVALCYLNGKVLTWTNQMMSLWMKKWPVLLSTRL